MAGPAGARTLRWILLIFPCVGLGAEPVVVQPGTGPKAALEVKAAFDDFMRLSQRCESAGDAALACICGEAAVVERLNASLESALAKHPGWRERPLRYKGYEQGSTLQIGIPALQEQMSMITAQCERQ